MGRVGASVLVSVNLGTAEESVVPIGWGTILEAGSGGSVAFGSAIEVALS